VFFISTFRRAHNAFSKTGCSHHIILIRLRRELLYRPTGRRTESISSTFRGTPTLYDHDNFTINIIPYYYYYYHYHHTNPIIILIRLYFNHTTLVIYMTVVLAISFHSYEIIHNELQRTARRVLITGLVISTHIAYYCYNIVLFIINTRSKHL